MHKAPIQLMVDYRFCFPHNACFSNILASSSGTLGEKCKLAHSEPCSMSGDLERSGRPRGAQATVALVWWRGIELTWSWGGAGGKLDSGRTLPKGKPRAYAISVSAGRGGGGGGPNISEGRNLGSTPPVYQLVREGG